MTEFRTSKPPELPGLPSVGEPLPGLDQLIGRPRALGVDLLGELHGPLFYADFTGSRKLYACSLELVSELYDEGPAHGAGRRPGRLPAQRPGMPG